MKCKEAMSWCFSGMQRFAFSILGGFLSFDNRRCIRNDANKKRSRLRRCEEVLRESVRVLSRDFDHWSGMY